MKVKKCYNCKTEYNISFFGRNKSRKDGLANICKICAKIKSKEYYSLNKIKIFSKKNTKIKKIRLYDGNVENVEIISEVGVLGYNCFYHYFEHYYRLTESKTGYCIVKGDTLSDVKKGFLKLKNKHGDKFDDMFKNQVENIVSIYGDLNKTANSYNDLPDPKNHKDEVWIVKGKNK